jgi:hypothetical protein
MAAAPAYQEADMDSTDVADHEQFDAAARLLMASLRQSKALNIEIRQALQRREQADAAGQPEGADRSSIDVFGLLSDILDGASRS